MEEFEEKSNKEDEEEGLERSKGATQARKVKLSLVVSESSWMYVMPFWLRMTWEKSGCSLRKEEPRNHNEECLYLQMCP